MIKLVNSLIIFITGRFFKGLPSMIKPCLRTCGCKQNIHTYVPTYSYYACMSIIVKSVNCMWFPIKSCTHAYTYVRRENFVLDFYVYTKGYLIF